MTWQDIIKMPHVDKLHGRRDAGAIIFYNEPNPVKGEVFDKEYLQERSLGRSGSKSGGYSSTLETEFDDYEVSNYGRVKKDGQIVKPTENGNKYATMLYGKRGDNDKVRVYVPWNFHLKKLPENTDESGALLPSNKRTNKNNYEVLYYI
tara:strand:- start:220 stop:666 length:447 start_codon:yes stop_codon:yes gene_type:complete